MKAASIASFALFALASVVLPARLNASTVYYSLTGTYSPYDVSISFDTSLSGAALDNLSSFDISGTVSNFMETNTIPGFGGPVSLSVVISTDSLGNITDFTVTDTEDQVVTPTSDQGQTQGTTTYAPPPQDEAGFAAGTGAGYESDSGGVLFVSYPAFPGENPNDFYCTYSDSTGALITDNDAGFCPSTAVADYTPGSTVFEAGTAGFTSDPIDPGTPSETPEPAAVLTIGTGLAGLALLSLRRRFAK